MEAGSCDIGPAHAHGENAWAAAWCHFWLFSCQRSACVPLLSRFSCQRSACVPLSSFSNVAVPLSSYPMAGEETVATIQLQSLVQDEVERGLAPLRDLVSGLADQLKEKQGTGGGEASAGARGTVGDGGHAGRQGGRGGRAAVVTPRAAQLGPGAVAVASRAAQLGPGQRLTAPIPPPPSQVSTKACQAAACLRGCARSIPAGSRSLQTAGRPPSRTRQSCFRSCWWPALRSQMACPHSRRRSGHGS